jgi:hypothetical protein
VEFNVGDRVVHRDTPSRPGVVTAVTEDEEGFTQIAVDYDDGASGTTPAEYVRPEPVEN